MCSIIHVAIFISCSSDRFPQSVTLFISKRRQTYHICKVCVPVCTPYVCVYYKCGYNIGIKYAFSKPFSILDQYRISQAVVVVFFFFFFLLFMKSLRTLVALVSGVCSFQEY